MSGQLDAMLCGLTLSSLIMSKRQTAPGSASPCACTSQRMPAGANHWNMRRESLQAANTTSLGAATTRESTISRSIWPFEYASLAIETAEQAGIALAAFVRDTRLTVYARPDRIVP